MPTEDVTKKLQELEVKIDAVYSSVEKTRKYFLTSMLITLSLIILPAVGLIFAIPSFLSTYENALNSIDEGSFNDISGRNNVNTLKELQDLQRELGL